MPRVLVIDDSEAIRRMVQRVLGPAGYEVFVAADGKTGNQLCRSLRPDLVITDLRMPGDGFEAILDLRTSEPPVTILVMSGGNPEEDLKTLGTVEGLGPVPYMTKPFTVEELKAAVKAALSSAQEHGPSRGT